MQAFTVHERAVHANECAEDADRDPMLRRQFACPVCEAAIPLPLAKRVSHIKACAADAGVRRVKDLRTKLVPDDDVLDRLLDSHQRNENVARQKIDYYLGGNPSQRRRQQQQQPQPQHKANPAARRRRRS
jgi:hypothetical protein